MGDLLSATGLRPGGNISARKRLTTHTGTGTNDGDTISVLSMQDSEDFEYITHDTGKGLDGIQSVAYVRSLSNSRKETISVFSAILIPYPGAAEYGEWLETQFNNNIIPPGTAILLQEMDVTDDEMIQKSQDMDAYHYLELLKPELYEKSRNVFGEIKTIWRFIKLMQEKQPNDELWSYNEYLHLRTKYKRLDQHHYPPVSHLRQHDYPTQNDDKEQDNQSDKTAPSYHMISQNDLDKANNRDENTHCHYRSNNNHKRMLGEEPLGDNSRIWGDGTSVTRERKELPEEKENVLMSDENPYFLKQHWRQRVSNPSPLKGHRNPRVREKKVSQRHQEEQMYKIKDYLQDKEYSSHSKRSKLSSYSSRSNQFRQSTPRSRPQLSDKIMWNGKRSTFKQYSEAIEGHILQVGGGYLINKEFIKKYKIFAERGEDYFMSGSFTEDYCDISSSQACLDRTYLYGMLLSSNRRGGERNILLKYKNKHEGIMAWIEFNEKYEYNGSEEVCMEILEERIRIKYAKDNPKPADEYLEDLQADLQELDALLPEEYKDSKKCRLLYRNMMCRDKPFTYLVQMCKDSRKTFKDACQYLRRNYLYYKHKQEDDSDSDSEDGQTNSRNVQQASIGDNGCNKTGEITRMIQEIAVELDVDEEVELDMFEEQNTEILEAKQIKTSQSGEMMKERGNTNSEENTHSGVCEKTKEKNTNSGENKEKGKNTSSGESRETGEDINLGGSCGYTNTEKMKSDRLTHLNKKSSTKRDTTNISTYHLRVDVTNKEGNPKLDDFI
jgi:hypothetical protein